jgi:hypothetical protein
MFGIESHDREACLDSENETIENREADNLHKIDLLHGENQPILHAFSEQKQFLKLQKKLRG